MTKLKPVYVPFTTSGQKTDLFHYSFLFTIMVEAK